jgi:hypothetical protein
VAISASGSCKYHDAVVKERAEQLCPALSPTLEPCRLPRPLHTIISGYAVELPEELYCMTVAQIEMGGDKADAVAMRYLNRWGDLNRTGLLRGTTDLKVAHDASMFQATFKSVVLTENFHGWTLCDTSGKSNLEIIQTVLLAAWRNTFYDRLIDRSSYFELYVRQLVNSSHPAAEETHPVFKSRICFHAITLKDDDDILTDIDPQNNKALKAQLQQELADVARETGVAREIVQAAKKA